LKPEGVVLGGCRLGLQEPRFGVFGAGCGFLAQFLRHIKKHRASGVGGSGELAVALRRTLVIGQPVAVRALLPGNQASLHGGGKAGLHARRRGRDQRGSLAGCRVDNHDGLHHAVNGSQVRAVGKRLDQRRAGCCLVNRQAAFAG
jgi:hypothetical protein